MTTKPTMGDPDRYATMLDEIVRSPSPKRLADLDQVVHHWRQAGWSDLAIGAMLAAGPADDLARVCMVAALRRVT